MLFEYINIEKVYFVIETEDKEFNSAEGTENWHKWNKINNLELWVSTKFCEYLYLSIMLKWLAYKLWWKTSSQHFGAPVAFIPIKKNKEGIFFTYTFTDYPNNTKLYISDVVLRMYSHYICRCYTSSNVCEI